MIEHFKNLPGVGRKTAERYAFALIEWEENGRKSFAERIGTLSQEITSCDECGSYKDSSECTYCSSSVRDDKTLLIVAYPKEVYSLEELGGFRGKFHVLGGLLSPLDGIEPDHLRLSHLKTRIENNGIEEIILALDTTIEGDATALYIKELLSDLPVAVSRLAHGMPIGSSLEYIDEHTLHQAYAGRRDF